MEPGLSGMPLTGRMAWGLAPGSIMAEGITPGACVRGEMSCHVDAR